MFDFIKKIGKKIKGTFEGNIEENNIDTEAQKMEDDGMCFQKMLAKQGFIDGFPVEPCRPAVKRQDGFLLFQVQAVPPLCNVPDWFGCVGAHPC